METKLSEIFDRPTLRYFCRARTTVDILRCDEFGTFCHYIYIYILHIYRNIHVKSLYIKWVFNIGFLYKKKYICIKVFIYVCVLQQCRQNRLFGGTR